MNKLDKIQKIAMVLATVAMWGIVIRVLVDVLRW